MYGYYLRNKIFHGELSSKTINIINDVKDDDFGLDVVNSVFSTFLPELYSINKDTFT